MGIAKYFSKDTLALSQIMGSGSYDLFVETLNKHVVEIAFDGTVFNSDAKFSLDLLVRLLARLYPKLKLNDLTRGAHHSEKKTYTDLAYAINSKIELTDAAPTISVVLGNTSPNHKKIPIIYIASNQFDISLSTKVPIESGNSGLPFAAGVIACIAASNIFRHVFFDLLGKELDQEFSISLTDSKEVTVINPVYFRDTTLVGCGAIGNAVMWSFLNVPQSGGEITIIDPETISDSNLQRYVLFTETDVDRPKIEVVNELCESRGTTFKILPHQTSFEEFTQYKYGTSSDEVVLVGVDSAKARIRIQSSLPKTVINGYTENKLAGISRHFSFGNRACLACGYIPSEKVKSYSMEVAENLGIPQLEQQVVREYLYRSKPVDDTILDYIAKANYLEKHHLLPFLGKPMNVFYSEFVCGGIMMRLTNSSGKKVNIEAPIAFQSALSGIMVALEYYLLQTGSNATSSLNSTHFYALGKIREGQNPHTFELPKDVSGRCICSDADFQARFSFKWNPKVL